MEIKAKDMCPRCKYCLGMTPQGMYSCGKANDGSELNIGIDAVLICANFEWKDEKVEGKVSDICPNCKNCKGITKESNGIHDWLTEVECEGPYDGMTKTLDADSDICCSMFELKEDKLMQYYREKSKNYEQILTDISRFVPVDVIDFKDLPKIIEQMRKTGDMYDSISESYDTLFDQKYEFQKANEKLEDKVHKLERRLKEEKKRFDRLDTEFLMPLAHVLYPNEQVCKEYSEVLTDVKLLKKEAYDLKEDCKRLAEKNKTLDKRNTNQCVMIEERDKEIESLKKMVERRDKWVDELKTDIHTLQNEILNIRDIAQKAYDDTNRD